MTSPPDFGTLLAAERSRTLAQVTGLERDFATIVESASLTGADDEHDPEGATLAFERQHVAALLSQAREHLAAVGAAERRLAGGSYGRCERCGGPIGPGRLAARPTATTCINCAARR
jgi:DnaK suppressor protein